MTANSRRTIAASVPAMSRLLTSRPDLAACFPVAAAFAAWASWSA